MILARTLPAGVASPTRPTGDASGKTPSDDSATPFGGVLDQLSDQRGRPSQTPDGSTTQDGQPRTSPPTLTALEQNTTSTALPDFALPTATYGLPTSAPIATTPTVPVTFSSAAVGTDAATAASSAGLAALFAGFSPAVVGKAAGAAAPETGTLTGRARNTGKAASTSGDAVPASAAAAPAAAPIPNLFDLAPVASPQLPSAAAAKTTTGQDLPATAATAALADQAAGTSLSVDGAAGAVARGAVDASHAHADSSRSDAFSSALDPMVRSVSVQTQLAPAVSLQPMQQVITSVQKLAAAASSAAVDLPTAPAVPLQSSRTMTLVLEPPDLGTVTVRMQLRGDSLDLQLDVGNAQTLGLLSRDKDSLTAAMTSQDYQIGTLTMRASDTQTSSQGSDHGSRPQDQSAGGSQGGGGDASQQGGQASQGGSGLDSGSRQEQRGSRSQAPDDEIVVQRSAGVADASAAGGLYI